MGDTERMSTATKIKWIVKITLPILFMLIPTNEIYTAQLRAYLAATIFFICLAALELIPVLLTRLILPILYVISGVTTVNVALAPWSSSFMIWAVIGGFAFAYVLEETGLVKRIVYLAAIKCNGKYVPLVLVLLTVGFFIQFITFINAWLLFIVLCFGVVGALNLKHTKQGIIIMMLSQIVAAGSAAIFYTPTNGALLQAGAQMADLNFTINWLSQPFLGWLYIPINFIIVCIFLKLYKVSKTELSGGKEYFEKQYASLGKITRNEKWAAIVIICIMLYLITANIHKLDGNYAFVIFPILLFFPGINAASPSVLKKVDVGFVVFLASCMSIGTVGIGNIIGTYLAPMLAGCPIPVFLVGCLLLGIIMNVVMTPVAMLAMLDGPLALLGTSLGITHPMAAAMALFFSNELVFMPYENTFCLAMYGFDTMSMKDFMQYNVIKMILFVILFAVLIIPYWYFVGII